MGDPGEKIMLSVIVSVLFHLQLFPTAASVSKGNNGINTEFLSHIMNGELAPARAILQCHSDSLNTEILGQSAIQLGKRCGNIATDESVLDFLELVLKHPNSFVNARDSEGRNLFHMACNTVNRRLIKLCQEHNVDVLAKDIYGRVPRDYLCMPTLEGNILIKKAERLAPVFKTMALLLNAQQLDFTSAPSALPKDVLGIIGQQVFVLVQGEKYPKQKCTLSIQQKRTAKLFGVFTELGKFGLTKYEKNMLRGLVARVSTDLSIELWHGALVDIFFRIATDPNSRKEPLCLAAQLLDTVPIMDTIQIYDVFIAHLNSLSTSEGSE